MRFKLLASEAWRSITANVSTTFAAAVTVLIGMFLVGLLIGFGSYARSWSSKTKADLVVHVYFCTAGDPTDRVQSADCKGRDATQSEINTLARSLQRNPLVGSIQFISKEQALEKERKKNPEAYALLASNPLPDALKVKPKRGEQLDALAASLKPYPSGVGQVTFGKKTAHKILDVAHLIELVFLVAVAVLLVASTLLIGNTIRLSIFARRREVEVMKLVGASNWFIRGPFMLEGLITGFVGALMAVILLFVGKELVVSSIWFHDTGVHALSFPLNALIVLGLGLLLGAAGSGLTLRRFLKV
jgi:cell division transport system permease protein